MNDERERKRMEEIFFIVCHLSGWSYFFISAILANPEGLQETTEVDREDP